MANVSIDQLRRYAIGRSLFKPTTLPGAIARLGFVQADPIRAPARAQDLILAHRVRDYRVGLLERRYPRLPLEEAFFINYGFLPRETLALLHPRGAPPWHDAWDARTQSRARKILAFVRRNGRAYAKDVQAHFDHGTLKRWGADFNVSAHLLDGLHYRGLLRVARRVGGTRVYEASRLSLRREGPKARLARAGRLLDIVVRLYAPLPAPGLRYLCALLRNGVSHLTAEVRTLHDQAPSRYGHAEVDGVRWFWPPNENPGSARYRVDDQLRFLTPFDPVVWDRRRFRLLWGWEYRSEAYVPAHARRRGHYAMPLLWRERVLGWANLKMIDGQLHHELGFAGRKPRGSDFQRALDEALDGMRQLLDVPPDITAPTKLQ